MQSRVYKLTPAEVVSIQTALNVHGNQGTFNPPDHDEITLGYSLSGLTPDGRQWLTLTILHEGFFEFAGMIWPRVDALMPPDAVPAN
jgi:hypothetical protein